MHYKQDGRHHSMKMKLYADNQSLTGGHMGLVQHVRTQHLEGIQLVALLKLVFKAKMRLGSNCHQLALGRRRCLAKSEMAVFY